MSFLGRMQQNDAWCKGASQQGSRPSMSAETNAMVWLVVELVLVGVVSLVGLGYLAVRLALPLRKAPTPGPTVPKGFGAVTCELVGGSSTLISPISGRVCVAWQLEFRGTDSTSLLRGRCTANWCDELLVRLPSGDAVTIALPERGVVVNGLHRQDGEFEAFKHKVEGAKGGEVPHDLDRAEFQEVSIAPGDPLVVVGTFESTPAGGDPMRRGEFGAGRVRLLIPPRSSRRAVAAILQSEDYRELGWRGKAALRSFFDLLGLWLGLYGFYFALRLSAFVGPGL